MVAGCRSAQCWGAGLDTHLTTGILLEFLVGTEVYLVWDGGVTGMHVSTHVSTEVFCLNFC
jgi:hypothetical protein